MGQGPEILTVAEMGAADRAAIAAGTPGAVLMQRAGAGVAEAVLARFPKQAVVVLCGPGNNGGDGYVAARQLAEAGWPVRTASMARAALKGDAAQAAAAWTGEDAPLSAGSATGAGLVVDALFG
ncbi:MAG TPA: NAD(P)H-hydrate epimerase, partial [Caulobacteraceae bacterium]